MMRSQSLSKGTGMLSAKSAAPARLPVTVLSGYLGAGKTTLLNRLLNDSSSQRVGVLVNDFGAVNIDENLITNRDGQTIGLTNGCVCCSIADDLGAALDTIKAVSPPLTRVILEASGVADPARVAAYPSTWPGFRLAGVTVVVDATRIRQQLNDKYIGATVARQLRACRNIVLSHTDLLSDEGAAVSAWLVEVHGGSSVSSLVRDPLGGLDHTSEADLSGPKIEPDLHDQHHAFVWETSHLVDAVALEQVLDQLPSSVARAKGFIAVPSSGPPLVLQSTGDRWALCPMEDVTGMAASVQRAAGGQLTFVISPCSHPMAVEQQVRELLSGIERP